MSAKGQAQTQTLPPQPAACPAPRAAGATLGRQCAKGCGAHTLAGGVCKDCRREGNAPASPPAPARGASAPTHAPGDRTRADERTPPPPPNPGRTFAGVRASVRINDADEARAEATRALLARLVTHLGLNPESVEIRVDAEAERRTEARGASGLMAGGVVYLHPRRFDPRTPAGAYLVGHELTHAAQRARAGAGDALRLPTWVAELEAQQTARAFAGGRSVAPPLVALPASHAAANVDVDSITHTIDAHARENHQRELARIHQLLARGFFDWAVTDGEVTNVLTILSLVPMVTARAIVRALSHDDRDKLIDNIGSAHYKQFSTQILAAYWGSTVEELHSYSDKIAAEFIGDLNLRYLDKLEAQAFTYVSGNLSRAAHSRLVDDPKVGGVAREVIAYATEQQSGGELEKLLKKAVEDAGKEEEKLRKEREYADDIRKSITEGSDLGRVVKEIKQRMSKLVVYDSDAIASLNLLIPYVRQPEFIHAVAVALVEPTKPPEGKEEEYEEKDFLDELIRQTPVAALYTEGDLRRVFYRLLTFRPDFKNEELAESLVDTPWYSAVTSEDAYLAFQLVKAMPKRARAVFYNSNGGANWKKVTDKMPVSMRESETLNLYTGGEGDKDREALLVQLISDEVWQAPDTARLDGLIRMAIAAGEHEFVFEQSRNRAAHLDARLKPLVDKYRLYDPNAVDAKGRKRDTYYPEQLEGLGFWQRGATGWINQKIFQTVDFLVDSTRPKLIDGALTIEGANLAELQDILGGSAAGARFTRPEELGTAGQQAAREEKGTNFGRLIYDRAGGRIDLAVQHVALSAIHMPLGDTKVQTGRVSIDNLDVRMQFPGSLPLIPGLPDVAPSLIDVYIGEMAADDVTLVSPDSMKAINTARMVGARLLGLKSGVDYDKLPKLGEGVIIPTAIISSLTGPMEFEVTLNSLKLSGITTSGGRFVEEVELKDLSLYGGASPDAYRKALTYSATRLDTRLRRERKALADASTPEEQRRHAATVAQLEKQITHTRDELTALDKAVRTVEQLEDEQRRDPDHFNEAQRVQLRKLKASLGGAVLDVGSVSIKGLAGVGEDKAKPGETPKEKKPFTLQNIHGQGRGSVAALGSLIDSDQLRGFIFGDAEQPVLKGERTGEVDEKTGEEKPALFTLDIADVDVPSVKLKGGIPKAKDADADYKKFLAGYQPWRKSHQDELARLEERKNLAARYEALLSKPGVNQLTAKGHEAELREFKQARQRLDELEEQAAVTIGRIALEGPSITIDAEGQFGVKASKFRAEDVRKGKARIAEVSGTEVQIGVDITDGVFGLDEWRKNLNALKLSGQSLVAKGITDEELGVRIDSASLLGVEEAGLSIARGEGAAPGATVGLKTKMVIVEGVHLQNVESLITAERDYLKNKIASTTGPPNPHEQRRLLGLEGKLDELKGLRTAVAKAETALKNAEGKQGKKAAAEQARNRAQADLDRWAQGLIAGKLTLHDVDVGVEGLGDVLAEGYDFNAVLRGQGVTVKGRGPGGRLLSGAEAVDSSVPGLSGKKVTTGALTGDINYKEEGTTLSNIHLASLAVEGLEWRGGKKRVSSKNACTLLDIKVDAFFSDLQINVKKLDVGAVLGDQLVYADEETGLEATVRSGGLGGVHVTDLVLDLPLEKGQDTKISKGRIVADKVNNLDLNVKLLKQSLEGHGVLSGSNISVEFLTDKKRLFKVGDLSLASGEAMKLGEEHGISLSFKHLRGEVEQEALDNGDTRYTFHGIGLSDFTLGPGKFADKGTTLEINGQASLKGAELEAVALVDKKGKPKKLLIKRLYVKEISANNIHALIEPTGQPKPGEEAASRKEFWLESGTILGLDITELDLAKDLREMTGKIAIQDTVNIQNLRALIGEKGKDAIDATFSLKAGGAKSADPALRGRELSATLLGKDGFRFSFGTIGQISGNFEGFGVTTGFQTGMITTSPAEVSADFSSVRIKEIDIGSVKLTAPVYKDGKGTVVKLKGGAHTTRIFLSDVEASFDVATDAKGKTTSRTLKKIDLTGVNFDYIEGVGLEYTGPATVSDGATSTKKIEADKVSLSNLMLNSLSHDFKERLTKIDATLGGAKATNFVGTFTKAVGQKTTQTRVFSDIDAGSMAAKLTLKGTKVNNESKTELDDLLFELTDPTKGLGLTNMRVTRTVDGKEQRVLGALDPAKTAGLDLKGLKVHLAPDGKILAGFDELTASNLQAEIGGAKLGLALAKIKGLAVGLKGLDIDKGVQELGLSLQNLHVEGLNVSFVIDQSIKGAPDEQAGTPLRWVLEPLGNMQGALDVRYSGAVNAQIGVPIRAGVIQMREVFARTALAQSFRTGIDEKGIYIAVVEPNTIKYHIDGTAGLPGLVQDTFTEKGHINLRTLIEHFFNAPPDPDVEALKKLEGQEKLDRIAELNRRKRAKLGVTNDLGIVGAVKLGGGKIGTAQNYIELADDPKADKATGSNHVRVSSVQLGSEMRLALPDVFARKAVFTALGRKGETGEIAAKLNVTISGLSGPQGPGQDDPKANPQLTFTLSVIVENGDVKEIVYGDVGIRTEAEKFAKEKQKQKP